MYLSTVLVIEYMHICIYVYAYMDVCLYVCLQLYHIFLYVFKELFFLYFMVDVCTFITHVRQLISYVYFTNIHILHNVYNDMMTRTHCLYYYNTYLHKHPTNTCLQWATKAMEKLLKIRCKNIAARFDDFKLQKYLIDDIMIFALILTVFGNE